MPLPLDQWHTRIDTHFRSLADQRGSGLPIFALEHPFTPAEVAELSSDLRKHMAAGYRPERYWLPWIVYATEIGYRYTGEEYWNSFAEQTPGWEKRHEDLVRDWFRKFQTTYHGVTPSGPWAKSFTRIAWPITHAILPKLLQHQFAAVIYQQRYHLAGQHNLNSLSAGRLLASHAEETSTRFKQFLQQEELTGRILLGLLGSSLTDGPEPIYQPTLRRIIADLDAVRTTRAWLKDVRTVVGRFKGIAQGSGLAGNRTDAENVGGKNLGASVQCDIRPRVFLRHVGAGKWTAVLDIPSFAPVTSLRDDLRSFLKEARCRVAGASDMKPAGWTLSQSRVAVLKSWPNPSDPLVIFDKSHSVLDHLLRTDCVLSRGPVWLFRIGTDGIAREILSRAVRPGSEYILLTSKQPQDANTFSHECVVECAGVRGFRISLPQSLSAADSRWLHDVGLQIARSIRVWPAGLPCRGWDGEGQSEWLTTEEPCFGIVHDHPVSSYLVQLDGINQGVITAPGEGVPAFVRLSPLSAGKHRLNITAERHEPTGDTARSAPLQGFVELLVREPKPWIPGIPAHSGLVVRVDPHDANLDKFWENKLAITVFGPESHTIDCSVSLERSDGEQVFFGRIASRLPLPVAPETWQKRFAAFLKENDEAANWCYPGAAAGRLCIKAGELGEFSIRFYGDIQPVRWLTRRDDGSLKLTLLDETGLAGDPECEIFGMQNPVRTTRGNTPEVFAGISIESPGALAFARHGEHQDALVVSYGLARHGLQGLGVKPDASDIKSERVSLSSAILTLSLWLDARLAGPLAEIRRKQVTAKLLSAIYAKLCGGQWAAAEEIFFANPSVPSTSDALLGKVHPVTGFALVLKRDHVRLFDEIERSTAWYSEVARRYPVCKNPELYEFAVRLAVFPQTLPKRYGSVLEKLTKQAAADAAVIKGARFAALLCSQLAPVENDQFFGRQRWR